VCWWEGGQPVNCGRSHGDGTLLQRHHSLLEIGVSQGALQITSDIKQEILSRICQVFFTIE
jgi:hypothetical protein